MARVHSLDGLACNADNGCEFKMLSPVFEIGENII